MGAAEWNFNSGAGLQSKYWIHLAQAVWMSKMNLCRMEIERWFYLVLYHSRSRWIPLKLAELLQIAVILV